MATEIETYSPPMEEAAGDALKKRKYRVIQQSKSLIDFDLAEIWRFRNLLVLFFERDMKVRYKQTSLGILWLVLQPLSTTIIYTIFFGYIARIKTGNLPFAVFLLGGLVIWQYFSRAVNEGSGSLAAFSGLISKVYFPRLLAPIASMFSALLDFFVMLVILVGVMAVYKVFPSWTIIAAPLFLFMAAYLAFSISLCLTGIDAKFRDVRYALNFVMQVWYFASPVVYPVTIVPASLHTLYYLNPMTPVVQGFRWSFLNDAVAPPLWSIGFSLLVSTVILFIGLIIFHRTERDVVDYI